MTFKKYGWLVLALCAGAASAQIAALDPDWKESDAPAPPSFNKDQLIPIDMPHYVSLRFGVDPATLVITPEGIVRYVMVASNASGSISAMYEGIRCATGEVKTYARFASSGHWVLTKDAPWQDLNGGQPSKHALALARQGACDSRATTANSVAEIVKALKK